MEPAARSRRVGGGRAESALEGVEIPEKAEIESEWAELQTGLAEQQAYAEIDSRSGKDDEDEHDDANHSDSGRPRDPSFIGPAVQDGAPPRSDALSRVT